MTQYQLENEGNERRKGDTDTYYVPAATSEFTLSADDSDGWCFDKITYGGKDIDLSSCCGGKMWLA